ERRVRRELGSALVANDALDLRARHAPERTTQQAERPDASHDPQRKRAIYTRAPTHRSASVRSSAPARVATASTNRSTPSSYGHDGSGRSRAIETTSNPRAAAYA